MALYGHDCDSRLDAVNARRIKQIVFGIDYFDKRGEFPDSSMFPNVSTISLGIDLQPRHKTFVQNILSQVDKVDLIGNFTPSDEICYPNVEILLCDEYCRSPNMLPKQFPNVIEFQVEENEGSFDIPYANGQIRRLKLELVSLDNLNAYENIIETVEDLEISWFTREMDDLKNLSPHIWSNATKLKQISLTGRMTWRYQLHVVLKFLDMLPDHVKVNQTFTITYGT